MCKEHFLGVCENAKGGMANKGTENIFGNQLGQHNSAKQHSVLGRRDYRGKERTVCDWKEGMVGWGPGDARGVGSGRWWGFDFLKNIRGLKYFGFFLD